MFNPSNWSVTAAPATAWLTATVVCRFTVTACDVPEEGLYTEELAASGVYAAVSIGVPAGNVSPGTAIAALPAVSVAAADV
jgi:hypothetical protein